MLANAVLGTSQSGSLYRLALPGFLYGVFKTGFR